MALGHEEGAGGTQERSPARGKFSEPGSKGGYSQQIAKGGGEQC